MKDRVPTYPGRVRLTPVAGQENVYDLERADEPTEVGTPLSKANLLTDATATVLGLSAADATVNNALAAIWDKAQEAKSQAEATDAYLSGFLRCEYKTYSGRSGGGTVSLEFSAPPVMVIIADTSANAYTPLAIFTAERAAMITKEGAADISITCTVSGNTLTWTGDGTMMNASGTTYFCVAFVADAE